MNDFPQTTVVKEILHMLDYNHNIFTKDELKQMLVEICTK